MSTEKNYIELPGQSIYRKTRSRALRVAITPEADIVVQRLQLETGMSARQIVSEMIIQGESLVRFVEDDGLQK